jgi:hypothetical protein
MSSLFYSYAVTSPFPLTAWNAPEGPYRCLDLMEDRRIGFLCFSSLSDGFAGDFLVISLQSYMRQPKRLY